MGRSRYRIHVPDAPHFLTCTAVGWLPLFARPDVATIVLDALRFLQQKERLTLHAYVVMVNHLHLIARADDLAREVAAFKSYTARTIVDHLTETGARSTLHQLARHKRRHKVDRMYQVWQEGSHPQQIQGRAMLRQKLDYIHANPVRRGYVDDPVHWRYSSARIYAGQEGLLPVMRVDPGDMR
jgi:REP element-mobilizing transposase RayT